MTRSSVSRNTALVAGLVALVYVSLAAMAASCAFSHVDSSNSHAHHGAQEPGPHSGLCAWACQATSDAGLMTAPTSPSIGPVVRRVLASPHQNILAHASSPLHSRAPPAVSCILVG